MSYLPIYLQIMIYIAATCLTFLFLIVTIAGALNYYLQYKDRILHRIRTRKGNNK